MTDKNIETHPLQPFIPEGARILMLGSFPPKKEKWSMDFFYPNFINDMWRIFGLVFFGDRQYFVTEDGRNFDKDRITGFCSMAGIALYDSATEVIRLKDNASDKFLEVVSPTDIISLVSNMPDCRAIVTTGQKATDTAVSVFNCEEPAIGNKISVSVYGRTMDFFRMPSSSRAYPLSLDKKAEIYRRMFSLTGFDCLIHNYTGSGRVV